MRQPHIAGRRPIYLSVEPLAKPPITASPATLETSEFGTDTEFSVPNQH